jgi:hypothetical protein
MVAQRRAMQAALGSTFHRDPDAPTVAAPLQARFEGAAVQRERPSPASAEPRAANPEPSSAMAGPHAASAAQTSIRAEPVEARPNQTGMPNQLKAGIESLSGMDLSAVRVHRNSDKPAQLSALAYAQGNHIHLGPGQEQHLPHEAWHVVQQRQGRVRETLQMAGMGVNDEVGLEREADVMGGLAISQGTNAPAKGKHLPPTADSGLAAATRGVDPTSPNNVLVVQRLAIKNYDDYRGYLNGDGMIRKPSHVGDFVGILRAGRTIPSGNDPMTAAMNVEMVATPDEDAQYMNAKEYDNDDDDEPEIVTKNVLVTGHHRLAAYAELGLDPPDIAKSDEYAMYGYSWSALPDSQYELKESDIPVNADHAEDMDSAEFSAEENLQVPPQDPGPNYGGYGEDDINLMLNAAPSHSPSDEGASGLSMSATPQQRFNFGLPPMTPETAREVMATLGMRMIDFVEEGHEPQQGGGEGNMQ